MTAANPLTAACLTPPAAGGIALIQVAGPHAARVVEPMLKRRFSLHTLPADEVRLCRLVDGDQTIDEALVTARHGPQGDGIIDLSLHGGPRIVQRVLLMLKRSGAAIVEPSAMRETCWPAMTRLQQEAIDALLKARTRAVAAWLARAMEQLPVEVDAILRDVRMGSLDAARAALARACEHGGATRYLLAGVRVTLYGEPNTGKSTLVNQLAGRDAAIVHPSPGTTRDWVEYAGAVDGIPVTFVDTAGIRDTQDPLEREAIRRTHEQIEPADVAIRVIDGSTPPTVSDLEAFQTVLAHRDSGPGSPRLLVWNKSDLGLHPEHKPLTQQAGTWGLRGSAMTGEGLGPLRRALVEAVGLTGWQKRTNVPFTPRQLEAYGRTLSVLHGTKPDRPTAVRWLQSVIAG